MNQVVVGDNNPDAQGSIGLNVAYKGFYLECFIYVSVGSSIL